MLLCRLTECGEMQHDGLHSVQPCFMGNERAPLSGCV